MLPFRTRAVLSRGSSLRQYLPASQRHASTSESGSTDTLSVVEATSVEHVSDFIGDAAGVLVKTHSVLSADGSFFGWGVTLAVTAFAARAVSFPLLYYGQVQQTRAALASTELGKIQSFVRSSQGNLIEKYMSFRRLRAVALGACGTSSLKLVPWYAIVNIPIFVTASLAIRRIVSNAPAEWSTSGISGWFPDLSAADPTGALPVINTGLWIWNAHSRSASASATKPLDSSAMSEETELSDVSAGQLGKVSVRSPTKRLPLSGIMGSIMSGEAFTVGVQALAIFSFPYIIYVPSGMLVFWVTSGSLTALQRALLSSDSGRSAIGLPTRAELDAARRAGGPQVLQATGRAVRAVREQLEYVQSNILTRFADRAVDAKLEKDVNRALRREKKHGRIGIDLEAEIREDLDTGRKYLAVVRKGTVAT